MSMRTDRNMRTRVDIRWMIRRDLPDVLAIENASFEFPWCEEKFLRILGQQNHIGMVAEHNKHIIGTYIYALRRDWIELLTFAVQPEFRGRGLGRLMIAKLVGKLSAKRRTRIVLYLRETNLPAQLFFRAVGFRAEAVLRGHFKDTGEDAYGMECCLSGSGGTL